jgi:hypothetical protein
MGRSQKVCILLLLACFAFSPCSFGQSLGDVARQHRQEEQTKGAQAKPKVITNDDLPDHGDPSSNSNDDANKTDSTATAPRSGDNSAASKEQKGQQWKETIQHQKEAVASMQSQLDKLNDSIHFVEANRYSNGVQYNQYQAKKQEEAQRMQKQLDEQKKKLADMQESARREGFGSAVYDP